MSDVDLIREALKWAHGCAFGDGAAQERVREALALLDGVTGFARAGDVILSAEQVTGAARFVKARRLSHYTHDATSSGCCPNCDRRVKAAAKCARCGAPYLYWLKTACNDEEADALLALLASGRPGEEQA